MARYRKPTIEEQGGLLPYLTVFLENEANKYSPTQVIDMLDGKASNTSIGDIVGHLPSTIKHWRTVRKNELKQVKKNGVAS
jgi:hypothetical protein